MAYTTIKNPKLHFNTVLYTGNNSSPRTITGVGFQPDMNWSKIRSTTNDHWLSDVVRGSNKIIRPNGQDDELVNGSGGYISAFNADGYVIAAGSANNANFNLNNGTMASWNWKAGGSQGSSNTDGSINTTYTSVNTTAGFSISQYTGTASAGATIGHGLGAVPSMIITKNYGRSGGAGNWIVYHKALGNTKYLVLNDTAAQGSSAGAWNNTTPTSSVFTVGDFDSTNGSEGMVAYCFAEKTGYSKFGTYVGNGNADGNFVYTGFKPAFVIAKNATSSGYSWELFDNKRNLTDGVGNVIQKRLYPDSSAAEGGSASTDYIDFLSNGFKIRRAGDSNENGSTYIFMAFAEEPLIGDNPATAR